ncbi:hypothetical protein, partial [Kandleria vitulina]|uniref:hypothetical protein n=1 Tax=Kandleria vitulina TaxID=1630 RepID=UPI003320FF62
KTNKFQRHRKQEQAHKGHQALQQRLLQLASLQKQGTALPQLRDNILPCTLLERESTDMNKLEQ